jgi:tRNA-dihydrouridine synthase
MGRNLKNYHLKDILPENNHTIRVVPQIMSNEPEDFIFLAGHCIDCLGYEHINWNLGCPFRTAVGKKRGAGLLAHPEEIRTFLDRVMTAFPHRISVKTRLGLQETTGLFECMAIFNQYPLTEIIIHPRTGTQMYAGVPDQPAFAAYLSVSKHPVVYNGDITDTTTFTDRARQFPQVNRWMIGRGAIADPFLAGDIRTGRSLSPAEKKEQIYAFTQELCTAYEKVLCGPVHPADKLKGIWQYLSGSFRDGKKVFKHIKKVKHVAHYRAVVQKVFEEGEWVR